MIFKVKVDFDRHLQEWDGFGFNYVETSQTQDYEAYPQDYGGFSTLDEDKRREIIDLVFGSDGLKPGVIKMFFDVFHQKRPSSDINSVIINDNDYDHNTTSRWMKNFVRQGLETSRNDGRDLSIITTMYGPPAFMTKQKFIRGRDLDERYTIELAKYMTAWLLNLKEEGFPVKYISLHNEGEDFERWPEDGSANWMEKGHDYNMFWSPELVCSFMPVLRTVLDANGMKDIEIANGETTNWYRFSHWGYADELTADRKALAALGLITSHAFVVLGDNLENRWFSDARGKGINMLRERKPGLHAWGTSISWRNMGVDFLVDFHDNIYSAGVNCLIPWAGIQNHALWHGGDPNPGTAFLVDGNGSYTVEKGYYYYKNMCRAGQPGMHVAQAYSNNTELRVFAFAKGSSKDSNAFVLLNTGGKNITAEIRTLGSNSCFKAYRTGYSEKYSRIEDFTIEDDLILYDVPAKSVTTFFEG